MKLPNFDGSAAGLGGPFPPGDGIVQRVKFQNPKPGHVCVGGEGRPGGLRNMAGWVGREGHGVADMLNSAHKLAHARGNHGVVEGVNVGMHGGVFLGKGVKVVAVVNCNQKPRHRTSLGYPAHLHVMVTGTIPANPALGRTSIMILTTLIAVANLGAPAPALSDFSRLTSGEWRMTSAGGSKFYETWRWGPGGFSVRKFTHGVNLHDNNRPWRDLSVYYVHPQRPGIQYFGISPAFEGISEGITITRPAQFVTTENVFQTPGARKIKIQIDFKNNGEFHESLWESVDSGPYVKGNEWDHFHSASVTPVPRLSAPETPKATGPRAPLAPFAGKQLESRGSGPAGSIQRTQFEWVPYANALTMRTVQIERSGKVTELSDGYLYYHAGKKQLKALILSSSGAVSEGTVTAAKPSGLLLDLTVADGKKTFRRQQTLRPK